MNELKHIDHIGIVTPDLELGSAPYKAMGLEPEREDALNPLMAVKLRVFRLGESFVELIMPTDPSSPAAQALEARGPGLHHIAFRVTDIRGAAEKLLQGGARFLTPEPLPGLGGSRVMFLEPAWGAGTLIELVEHP
jgi:methylmalonyl-CoA/ethylmalonyl-CoA epimerase